MSVSLRGWLLIATFFISLGGLEALGFINFGGFNSITLEVLMVVCLDVTNFGGLVLVFMEISHFMNLVCLEVTNFGGLMLIFMEISHFMSLVCLEVTNFGGLAFDFMEVSHFMSFGGLMSVGSSLTGNFRSSRGLMSIGSSLTGYLMKMSDSGF